MGFVRFLYPFGDLTQKNSHEGFNMTINQRVFLTISELQINYNLIKGKLKVNCESTKN